MFSKQLSVFIENRKGRLGEVLGVLKENDINILSLSLADTTEYGLLRIITDNPETAKKKLSDSGFSTMLTDVLIIKIPHESGSLQTLLTLLTENGINIEYMYGLSVNGEKASVVLKAEDALKAERILTENGVEFLSTDNI